MVDHNTKHFLMQIVSGFSTKQKKNFITKYLFYTNKYDCIDLIKEKFFLQNYFNVTPWSTDGKNHFFHHRK